MKKSNYIATLSQAIQEEIKADLQAIGLNESDIDNAMDSRLSDLEDTIDINKYLV